MFSPIFKTFEWVDEEFDDIQTIETEKEGDPRLYITPEGNFPSMTSLIGQLSKKSDLDEWRKRVGEEEADKIVKEAIFRGNELHDYNEKYLKNILDRSEMSGQARILFNRVKGYLDKIEIVLGAEVALYSLKYKYAGRCDAIGMIDDKICIIDHKNSRNPINQSTKWGRQKLWKYQLQCCGYARALLEMKGIKASHGCLIVGNWLTCNADRFIFDLAPFEHDLDLLLLAWNAKTVKEKKTILKQCEYFQL